MVNIERQWCDIQWAALKRSTAFHVDLYSCFAGFLEREWGVLDTADQSLRFGYVTQFG
jgi:hypothetical protein